MPPEPPAASPDGAPRDGASPDASDAHPRSRRRLIVGAVVAGAVVLGGGGLALAALGGGGDRGAVEAAAAAYLDAIAQGRAAEATALVPVEGPTDHLTDDILGAAARIVEPVLADVELDGDAATIDVSYRAASGVVLRTLDAERTDDGWRITTSIAEAVQVEAERMLGARVAVGGIDLAADGTSLLYPGDYETDRVERALWTLEASRLVVDGDPRTPAYPLEPQLDVFEGNPLPEAVQRATAHLDACAATDACPAADGALTSQSTAEIVELRDDGGVTARVGFIAAPSAGEGLAELAVDVRATVGEDGAVAWACAGPVPRAEAGSAEFAPCGGSAA